MRGVLALLALHGAAAKVTELTASDFDATVYAEGGTGYFVKFFAPWCSHCKKLAPIWEELSELELGGVRLGHVDVTSAEGSPLRTRFNISGYPTLLFFASGGNDQPIRMYAGKRDLKSLEAFILDGWKLAMVYDPANPPVSRRDPMWKTLQKVVQNHPGLFKALACVMALMASVSFGQYHLERRKLRGERESKASPSRTYGNVPLSRQSPTSPTSPVRAYGNVPLSQQSPPSPARAFGNVPLSQQSPAAQKRPRSKKVD
jgi:thioredoxin domain-containing protein 5